MIGEVAALLAALCWAVGSLLFERLAPSEISPWATNLAKCVLGAVVLFSATMAVEGRPLPPGVASGDLGLLGLSAVVGLTVGDTAFFASLAELGASRAVLLLSTAPVFVLAMEAAWWGATPTLRDGGGIGLVLAGVAMVLWRPGGKATTGRGVMWGLVAALGQAGGSLLSRQATRLALGPLAASWFRLAVGAAVLVAVGLAVGQIGAWRRQLAGPGVLRRLGVASAVGTVLGLFLMQVGLTRSRSGGVASALLSLTPVFALPLGHLSGSERATVLSVAGVLVAFVGVALLL